MSSIEGLDKAKARLGNFEFNEFRIIRRFCFYDLDRGSSSQKEIEIVLDSDRRNSNFSLTLRFGGVSGLRLAGFGGGETRIIGFDIQDISNKQWENLNWEIIDF